MTPDHGRALREALKKELGAPVREDEGLSAKVAWGPHVYVPSTKQAWHVLPTLPETNAWAVRMQTAVSHVRGLKLGVAAPLEVIRDSRILEALDELQCAVLPVKPDASGYRSLGYRNSVCDVIYERGLVLEHGLASRILDRALTRALAAQDSYAKGALLELLIAVMLSQVNGFEVTDLNISSKNQEIDIHVSNRNNAGPLGRGQYVLAEAKNWKSPVPRKEYNAFASKIRSRRGMVKLGLLVTTSTFESGVVIEAIRESERDDLIVLLDKETLPKVWREAEDMTAGLERAVKRAVYDHEPE